MRGNFEIPYNKLAEQARQLPPYLIRGYVVAKLALPNFEIPYNKLAPSPPSSPLGERKRR